MLITYKLKTYANAKKNTTKDTIICPNFGKMFHKIGKKMRKIVETFSNNLIEKNCF